MGPKTQTPGLCPHAFSTPLVRPAQDPFPLRHCRQVRLSQKKAKRRNPFRAWQLWPAMVFQARRSSEFVVRAFFFLRTLSSSKPPDPERLFSLPSSVEICTSSCLRCPSYIFFAGRGPFSTMSKGQRFCRSFHTPTKSSIQINKYL